MNIFWHHVRWAYRCYSTTISPPITTPRYIKSARIIDSLYQHTNHPIWRLLGALNARPTDLPAALTGYGVPLNEYNYWKPVLDEDDISSAMSILKDRGIADSAGHIV